MFPGQTAFQQPAWQQGFNQPPQRTGPPPAKKPRNNPPIITRYPPPPGYKGPAQPQVPYQPYPPYRQQTAWQQPQAQVTWQQPQHQTTWQQPGQPHVYGQQPYAGYQPQVYGRPQPYPHQQYSAYAPSQQYPPTAFGPQQQYPPTTYASQNHYQPPAQGYSAPPTSTWQPSISTPQSAPIQQWNPPDSFFTKKRRHNSAPFPTSKLDGAILMDGNGDPLPPPLTKEDLEDDFFGECYFARHPEEINPELSLGLIEWRAALPLKRALPSTFAEAELEALAPRKLHPAEEESISDFFVKSKRDEAFLSVRQTEDWQKVKHDLIFREFPLVCSRTMTLSALLEKYRDRRDCVWAAHGSTPTPEPELLQIKAELDSDITGSAMEIDNKISSDERTKSEYDDEEADFLGNLEQVLQQNGISHSRRHSRASSVASTSSQKLTRPQLLMPLRDQEQEDILAALGVTGSPKVVYQTPGPALGAPPPQRNGSISRHNSVTSNPEALRVPAPPPPPPGNPPQQRSPSYDPWRVNGQTHRSAFGNERPGSSGSQHTAVGSDFRVDDEEATPRPNGNRNAGRKRMHEDSDDGAANGEERELLDDEETPKPRRKQPRADDAYRSVKDWDSGKAPSDRLV